MFRITGEYTDLNTYIGQERTHRHLAAKTKKEETWRVLAQIKQIFEGGRVLENMYPIHIVFVWATRNTRKDPDNVDFARKFLLDGMVHAGLLRNDSRKEIASLHSLYTVSATPYVEVWFFRDMEHLTSYLSGHREDPSHPS